MPRKFPYVFLLLSALCHVVLFAENVESWFSRFRKDLEQLSALSRERGQAEKGLQLARAFTQQLMDQEAGRYPHCLLNARVYLLRAIFQAQLQQWEGALWDYHVALSLDPEVANFTFADYPDLAPRFLEARDQHMELKKTIATSHSEIVVLQPKDAGAGSPVLPKKVRDKKMQYPLAFRNTGLGAEVEVFVVIDENGVPRMPVFAGDCVVAPFFAAATDAFREWRFEPPTIAGQPAVVATKMRARFQLRSAGSSPYGWLSP